MVSMEEYLRKHFVKWSKLDPDPGNWDSEEEWAWNAFKAGYELANGQGEREEGSE